MLNKVRESAKVIHLPEYVILIQWWFGDDEITARFGYQFVD